MRKLKGKLIGIGVGPGDSELITLKAAKLLEKIPIICSPRSAPGKKSIALSIISPIIKNRKEDENLKILEPVFPMTENEKMLEKHWDEASEIIATHLNKGKDVAFITLGDPSIYSTFTYIQTRLENDYEIEMIPGINSFTACASSMTKPLVEKDEILVIIPKIDHRMNSLLKEGDNFVLMKTSRNTEELENMIHEEEGKKEIISVENCTMENEKITEGFPNSKSYLTTTIVKLKK
ncbi:cobalt-precorrin-2 C(20)-methyltransferase [Methanobrevibacter cuticularis]|uniref:Cobalt-precorrin-2 C(20)-methyltransferase n=1 Tax=Methanobrevibacter cuticularis TaxID=47311 RepID=A0A166DSH8_9EURY|nr:precorrin-2 C(20)-methyltransferase [Methanobrevibacter cuticularis]KZX15908.1 cobalt-precorrin-2 C(20)-methyltransferase [Methanobrevibacter cuticularis]